MPLTFIPDPMQLRLLYLTATDTIITMTASTKAPDARCPLCTQRSTRVHSRYVRTLADLPWSGIAVQLRLHARRFFCDSDACARRIFTERIPTVADSSARRTHRLTSWFTHVAFALGGEPGSRLLRRGATPISGDTLLGHIRAFKTQPYSTPRILSIDDFAFRKGSAYGTIVVDLERHRVVDLLPDRSAESVRSWLVEHGGSEIISRDRGGEYAEGARRGAPEAMQIADRFHVIRNLGDVVRRVLQRHATVIKRVPAPGPLELGLARRRLDRETSKDRTRTMMRERFEQIHALAAEGLTKNAIARHLGLNRKTVYTYLALAAPPERRHISRQGSALAPYEGYILRRWEQGCRNGREVWREIQAQGYGGAYQNVARIMAYLRRRQRLGDTSPSAPAGLTPRRAVGLVLLRPDDRRVEERQTVEQLKTLDPAIRQAVTLLEDFLRMIRDGPHEHPREQLDPWIVQALGSGLPEFAGFVTKLGQDLDAVLAGLQLPWSQGQTEGQINKLKLLKRSMYGRANFDLLRQRVLYLAAA